VPPTATTASLVLWVWVCCGSDEGTKMGPTSAEPYNTGTSGGRRPGYAIGNPWWWMMNSSCPVVCAGRTEATPRQADFQYTNCSDAPATRAHGGWSRGASNP
jgi:hypothetical protein